MTQHIRRDEDGQVWVGDELGEIPVVDSPLFQPKRDRLGQIFTRQLELQKHLHGGVDPADFDPEQRSEYVRGQILGLEDELHEALAEIAWKPWSSDKTKFHRDPFVRELIDAFHFMVNLFLAAGVTADEFHVVFREKNDVNWARHKIPGESYDAGQGKCACGRSMDDYPTSSHWIVYDRAFHSKDCPEAEKYRQETA